MDLIALVLIIALIIYLIAAAPAGPMRAYPWGGWIALAIVLVCLTLMALGIGADCEGSRCD